jgi:threonine aldolase
MQCLSRNRFNKEYLKKEFHSDGTEVAPNQQTNIYFCYEKGNENHELGAGSSVRKRITSAVKRVKFVSDRLSYITIRGRWSYNTVLNVHAPTEDKTEDVKGSFYEELANVFNKFSKYHINILSGIFSAKIGREDLLQKTIGSENLLEISSELGD